MCKRMWGEEVFSRWNAHNRQTYTYLSPLFTHTHSPTQTRTPISSSILSYSHIQALLPPSALPLDSCVHSSFDSLAPLPLCSARVFFLSDVGGCVIADVFLLYVTSDLRCWRA